MDDISRIMGNAFHLPQTGQVEKIKEVTPRPEEGRTAPSPFNELRTTDRKEEDRRGKIKKKRPHRPPNTDKSVDAKEGDEPGDEDNHIDVIV